MYNHPLNHPSTPPAPAHDHFSQLPRQSTQPWQEHGSSQWSQATPELNNQFSRLRQEHERELQQLRQQLQQREQQREQHEMQQLWQQHQQQHLWPQPQQQ